MLKYAILILVPVLCWAQAGTPTTVNSWYELNEASDIHSNDLGCYSPSQVTMAYHNAQITMLHNVGAYSCGGNNGTNFSTTQDYLSGAIMWHDLNFQPTTGNPITIEVSAELAKGWPAIWLLGGNKAGNTGCQTTTPTSWDNFGTCFWSEDTMPNGDSAEIDIAEMTLSQGYTTNQEHAFMNNGSGTHGDQTISDGTTNFHLYHLDWSTSQECWAVDGVNGGCDTLNPKNPMFLIIENRNNGSVGNTYSGSFPVTMTIKYVQVCQGTSCTLSDNPGGNTLFLDDFGPWQSANTWASIGSLSWSGSGSWTSVASLSWSSSGSLAWN